MEFSNVEIPIEILYSNIIPSLETAQDFKNLASCNKLLYEISQDEQLQEKMKQKFIHVVEVWHARYEAEESEYFQVMEFSYQLPNGDYHGDFKLIDSNLTMIEGKYVDGKKEGQWKYSHPLEHVGEERDRCIGEYKNGFKIGEWTYICVCGNTSLIEIYWDSTNSKSGCAGVLKEEIYFNCDTSVSQWKYYNVKGEYQSVENYDENGILVSAKFYLGNGGKDFIFEVYNHPHSIRRFIVKVIDNHEIMEISQIVKSKIIHYVTLKDDKLEGEELYYYHDGRLKSKKFWVDDNLEGDYEVYYKNGALKRAATFKNHNVVGDWKEWYRNKNLKLIVAYCDQKKEDNKGEKKNKECKKNSCNCKKNREKNRKIRKLVKYHTQTKKEIIRYELNPITQDAFLEFHNKEGQLIRKEFYKYKKLHGTKERWNYSRNLYTCEIYKYGDLVRKNHSPISESK